MQQFLNHPFTNIGNRKPKKFVLVLAFVSRFLTVSTQERWGCVENFNNVSINYVEERKKYIFKPRAEARNRLWGGVKGTGSNFRKRYGEMVKSILRINSSSPTGESRPGSKERGSGTLPESIDRSTRDQLEAERKVS